MQLITASIHIIDYEEQQILEREIPNHFTDFLLELLNFITENNRIRKFSPISQKSQVVSNVITVCKNVKNTLAEDKYDYLGDNAERLLEKEISAQEWIQSRNLGTDLQKGSLVQALVYDETTEKYLFLFAKVEHKEFVDDTDFSFKTGFFKETKNIWKTCMMHINDLNGNVNIEDVQIHSNSIAKYWYYDFLELVELNSDQQNTAKSFEAVNTVLCSIKNQHPKDFYTLKANVLHHYRSKPHFDFSVMVEDVIEKYIPETLSDEKKEELIEKIYALPERKKFDRQFSTDTSAIKARAKMETIRITKGIELNLTGENDSPQNYITSERGDDGQKYLKVKTDNDDAFKLFSRDTQI